MGNYEKCLHNNDMKENKKAKLLKKSNCTPLQFNSLRFSHHLHVYYVVCLDLTRLYVADEKQTVDFHHMFRTKHMKLVFDS